MNCYVPVDGVCVNRIDCFHAKNYGSRMTIRGL